MILACITSLLATCCPIAVVGEISESVVSALDAVILGRRFSHISVEVLERHPSFTDRNALRAVAWIPSVVGVATSLKYATPATVNRQVRRTVGGATSFEHLSFVAPATDDIALSQISTTKNLFVATFATTQPVRAELMSQVGKRQHHELTIGLASNVFNLSAARARLAFSHDRSPESGLVRTAMQRQLLGCSHFTIMFSSGATVASSSFRKECSYEFLTTQDTTRIISWSQDD